jgi:hypothetical protein
MNVAGCGTSYRDGCRTGTAAVTAQKAARTATDKTPLIGRVLFEGRPILAHSHEFWRPFYLPKSLPTVRSGAGGMLDPWPMSA